MNINTDTRTSDPLFFLDVIAYRETFALVASYEDGRYGLMVEPLINTTARWLVIDTTGSYSLCETGHDALHQAADFIENSDPDATWTAAATTLRTAAVLGAAAARL